MQAGCRAVHGAVVCTLVQWCARHSAPWCTDACISMGRDALGEGCRRQYLLAHTGLVKAVAQWCSAVVQWCSGAVVRWDRRPAWLHSILFPYFMDPPRGSSSSFSSLDEFAQTAHYILHTAHCTLHTAHRRPLTAGRLTWRGAAHHQHFLPL
jgi:hypothetical protein